MLVYLHDILILSKNPEEHARHLGMMLDLLRQQQLYAKLPKCLFNKSELQLFGHIVGSQGIRMDPSKTVVITDWSVPKDVHQLQSFLCLATNISKFVQGFLKLASPMTDLLKVKDF